MMIKEMLIPFLAVALLACTPTQTLPEPSDEPSSTPSEEPSAVPSDDPSETPREPNSECVLYGLTFRTDDVVVETEVDEQTHTVRFEYGYDQLNALKACKVEAKMSEGAKLTPDPTQSQDYTRKNMQVRVTAEDGRHYQKYALQGTLLPAPRPKKPLIMWIDVAHSYGLLSTPEKVDETVQMIYDGGFTGIAVEVKTPVSGDVLYFKSDILGYAQTLERSRVVNQDFDLLQAMIDACHKRDMTLTVSYCIFSFAEPTSEKSKAYYEAHLKDAFCQQLLTTGIEDIREQPQDYWFLNPVHPAVRTYVKDVVAEIVNNYDIDGFALDYCRYPNIRSDFSDLSRAAFEQYIGHPVENWPDDVMKATRDTDDAGKRNYGYYAEGDHELFQQWMAWRAGVIQQYVKEIRDVVKAIKPQVSLELWAAAWFQYRNETGQNWGSYDSNWASKHYSWASPAYDKAGFAEYLDVFHLGNYVDNVYGNNWTMEYFTRLAKNLVGDACTLYNSFGLYTGIACAEATYYSYRHYDGVMIFELGTVAGAKQWDNIRSGYARAMRELGELE